MLLCHTGVYLEFLNLVSVFHKGQSSDMRDKIIDRNSLLFSVLLFNVSLPQGWGMRLGGERGGGVRMLADFSYCSSVHSCISYFSFYSLLSLI